MESSVDQRYSPREKHDRMREIPKYNTSLSSDMNLTDIIDVIGTGDNTQTRECQNNQSTSNKVSSSPYRAPSNMNSSAPNPQYLLNVKSQDPNRQKKSAFVKIVEQPAAKGLRFRYECEGRSAGSIPGAASTPDNRTFPTIQVDGYTGRAVVVASCVTSEPPYRPHPHQLVGKDGCKKGVCTMEISPTMSCSFPNLGIQCVKKKDIEGALALRQQIRVDPFQTGFTHFTTNSQTVDLNCVRLCFQVFLEGNEEGAFTFALKPVVSHPIYDKKAKCDLTIIRMTETCAPAIGGKDIMLFCDKISKDDIQVRFYEEVDGQVVWEGLADFQASDVHKQIGICFKTPRYKNIEIVSPVKVEMQLRRPSDGAVSESRPFEFLPLDMGVSYWSAKRMKSSYTIFNQILGSQQNSQIEPQAGQSLKHKRPGSQPAILRGRAPITNINGVFSNQLNDQNITPSQSQSSSETQEDYKIDSDIDKKPDQYRFCGQQNLKPVAMPGMPAVVRMPGSAPKQEIKDHPTAPVLPSKNVPLGAPIQSSTSLKQDKVFTPRPDIQMNLSNMQVGSTSVYSEQNRPISEISNQSEFSTITSKTHGSINDILSMADISSVYSLDTNSNTPRYSLNEDAQSNRYSMDLENIGVSDVGLGTLEEPNEFMNLQLQQCLKNPVLDIMGSMTSVSTVKENKNNTHRSGLLLEENSPQFLGVHEQPIEDVKEEASYPLTQAEKESMNINCSEMDLGQIYDDVMQCVYDDVDTKYDDISTLIQAEAPVPPPRKCGLSVEEAIDKPLPGVPKNPSLLHKFAEKKDELLKEREKEREKKESR